MSALSCIPMLVTRGGSIYVRIMQEQLLVEPGSRSFTSMRLRLHYVDWGNEGAPPLILLHGGRDHCRNWDWVARALQRDFHVIAPDLRGHGDSAWSSDGNYSLAPHVYDLAQLVEQRALAPVTIVAHSYGGFIASRYAGLYPEKVARLALIEGMWLSPQVADEHAGKSTVQRWHEWIDAVYLSGTRPPRRYPSVEAATARMQAENPRLSEAQARHLTVHGLRQNEDRSFSWKFDNYVRTRFPIDLPEAELQALWERISCPVLLVHGGDSVGAAPDHDWMLRHLRDGRSTVIEGAGHWPHHDRLAVFLDEIRSFLGVREAGDSPPKGA